MMVSHDGAEYKRLDVGFCTTLANATPNIFTFLSYPCMDLINSVAERLLRKVVVARKIRMAIAGKKGTETFGIQMSCLPTWEKRGLNISKQLDRWLWESILVPSPLPNIFNIMPWDKIGG